MDKENASARVGLAVKNDLLSRGINTKEAARKLGVTPAGVSVYFSGRPFSAKAARKWSKALELNEEFLVTGLGHPSEYVTMAVKPEEKSLILEMRKRGRLPVTSVDLDNILLERSLDDVSAAIKQLRGLMDKHQMKSSRYSVKNKR